MPNLEHGFPDRCIRGISSPECVLEGGTVAHLTLFDFHKSHRPDGWLEESINWMDDQNAALFTLNQRKEGREFQFKVGIAILERVELDAIKKRIGFSGYFDYERARMEGNGYHGNLLLKENTEKRLKNMIRSALALAVSEIVLRDSSQAQAWDVHRS
jgi:hypothetical protein